MPKMGLITAGYDDINRPGGEVMGINRNDVTRKMEMQPAKKKEEIGTHG